MIDMYGNGIAEYVVILENNHGVQITRSCYAKCDYMAVEKVEKWLGSNWRTVKVAIMKA